MRSLPEKKGYNIKNIYYSNGDGEIVKSSLISLENEELHFSRYYRRNNTKI
jgi:hypothetical protein